MALKDIVYGQENSAIASRGNGGVVTDNLASAAMEILRRNGILQKWNAAEAKWEVLPLRYKDGDGWV